MHRFKSCFYRKPGFVSSHPYFSFSLLVSKLLVGDWTTQARNGDSDRPLLAAELCGVEGPLVDYLGSDFFHDSLTLRMLQTRAELRQYYLERVPFLCGVYGVQLLLYSVVATRGCAALRAEMNDTSEPMIDSVHGYANQSLINLMLTGRAVANVWDDDRDVGGMTMRGIEKQSEVRSQLYYVTRSPKPPSKISAVSFLKFDPNLKLNSVL